MPDEQREPTQARVECDTPDAPDEITRLRDALWRIADGDVPGSGDFIECVEAFALETLGLASLSEQREGEATAELVKQLREDAIEVEAAFAWDLSDRLSEAASTLDRQTKALEAARTGLQRIADTDWTEPPADMPDEIAREALARTTKGGRDDG